MDKQLLQQSPNKQIEDQGSRSSSQQLDWNFLTEMNKTKDFSSSDKIQEYYEALKTNVSTLDSYIDTVLQRHEQDFLNAFKCQMYNLYNQLKELKKKTDENELKLRRDEQINRLQASLEWFREEAVKLGESTQYYKKEADKWKAKAESMEDDRKFLETQLKNAKRKIKTLYNELEKKEEGTQESLEVSQELSVQKLPRLNTKQFVPSCKAGVVILEVLQKHKRKSKEFLEELERYMEAQESKFHESVKHYKSIIENEKKKIINLNAQKNNAFVQKSDLEGLFLECVEEVRKEVLRRRAKSLLHQKFPRKSGSAQRERKDLFTPSDKRKILELLISNEQVLVHLYEKLFPHRANQFTPVSREEFAEDSSALEIDKLLNQVTSKSFNPKPETSFHSQRGSFI